MSEWIPPGNWQALSRPVRGAPPMIGLSPMAVELLREERVLAVVQKNASEQIRVAYREVNRRELVTVAVKAMVGDGYVPTKAGFGCSTLRELLSGLCDAVNAIEART
jgi:hypothetical protein